MVFSGLTFLYFFLPTVCVLYFLLPWRGAKNTILLFSSLLFYAWGEPKHILVMLCATVAAYGGGLLMHRCRESGNARGEKIAFLSTVAILLLNLLVFKYLGFLCDNLAHLPFLHLPNVSLALPIGISFYTFQILSYVIDLHREQVAVQKNCCSLALYICFFPQLIAGPIVRYRTVEQEISQRRVSWDDVTVGCRRFILGLSKKVLLANQVATVATAIYSDATGLYGTSAYWLAALAYTLQIYFDFSGYSDMAIGLGRIFGFHFLENFNYPYVSRSVTEFWRRWHISLSSWFRDYVYIPLGGSRVSRRRWICNILTVWALTGLWHGAEWNFVLWGLYYGLLLLLEKLVLSRWLEKLPSLVRWAYTFLLVNLGWVLFNLTDMCAIGQAFRMMFTYNATDWTGAVAADSSVLLGLPYLLPAVLCSFPLLRRLPRREGVLFALMEDGVYLGLFVLCTAYIISSSYNPFIYFRF